MKALTLRDTPASRQAGSNASIITLLGIVWPLFRRHWLRLLVLFVLLSHTPLSEVNGRMCDYLCLPADGMPPEEPSDGWKIFLVCLSIR